MAMMRCCGRAGKEVAVPEMSEGIKTAVLKGTLSHLLSQEVGCSRHVAHQILIRSL
jgi:hypothetical protein